jgi:transcription elongation factor Elf1
MCSHRGLSMPRKRYKGTPYYESRYNVDECPECGSSAHVEKNEEGIKKLICENCGLEEEID